jgi:hypothetical protein
MLGFAAAIWLCRAVAGFVCAMILILGLGFAMMVLLNLILQAF